MQKFNVRISLLESGLEISINDNLITNQDFQDFLNKIASKSSNTTTDTTTNKSSTPNDNLGSVYDTIEKEVDNVVDKTISDFDKAFYQFDDLFGDLNDKYPFDQEQINNAKKTVEQWRKTASDIIQNADQIMADSTSKAKQKADELSNKEPENFDVVGLNFYGVHKLDDDLKYTVNKLDDLKTIPGFYDQQQYSQFKYFYSGQELDRESFMVKIFNDLKQK